MKRSSFVQVIVLIMVMVLSSAGLAQAFSLNGSTFMRGFSSPAGVRQQRFLWRQAPLLRVSFFKVSDAAMLPRDSRRATRAVPVGNTAAAVNASSASTVARRAAPPARQGGQAAVTPTPRPSTPPAVVPPRAQPVAAPTPPAALFNFSPAELDLFARLVHSEAAGEPFEGQVAVAASVLNRIRSPLYPNTLSAVIFQVVGGFYQYSPVLDGRINLPANESARRAVQEALTGRDPSLGALGFYNPRKTNNQWVRAQQPTVTIGQHIFFR
ncbi:MAG: cell wall hydrolase [Dethiobacter sp.]|nr:cell wall hydrolase [Dethiobacter sp.]MCL5982128.1 cell wall hydrolase [Bacillota bacterium]